MIMNYIYIFVVHVLFYFILFLAKAVRRTESREEYESPQIHESNRTLRQQKFLLEQKRDLYLRERMDSLSSFLPETGNYFQRKDQGVSDGNAGPGPDEEDMSRFSFPLHTEYLGIGTLSLFTCRY